MKPFNRYEYVELVLASMRPDSTISTEDVFQFYLEDVKAALESSPPEPIQNDAWKLFTT